MKISRLTIKLLPEDHRVIKMRAADKYSTMTLWVIEAIREKIEREDLLKRE